MKKLIAGLAAGVVLALGGAANADFDYPHDGGYDLNLTVHGVPFYGKWMLYDDRPYVGVQAFSNALGIEPSHYYKAWSLTPEGEGSADPLTLSTTVGATKVNTIRLGGVTMIDLYAAADALDIPVHHDFRSKTIQVGDKYVGHQIPGKWYRYMNRTRGWTLDSDIERLRDRRMNDREWDDTAPRKHRL